MRLFGAFKSIPHPLRGSSLCTREPWVGAIFPFVPQRKQEQKSRFQHRKQQKTASLALSFSRSATAPSRREPLFVRVFSPHKKGNFCKYSENIKNDFLSRLEWISARIRCFPNNPSPAPRELPLHKGAIDQCDFRLCAAEKTEAKIKVSTPKTAENRKLRTLLQSLRDSSLSEGAFVCARFFFVPQRKQGGNLRLKTQNPHTFLLRQRSTSSVAFLREEGVTRERDGRSPRDGKAADSRGFAPSVTFPFF